MYVPYELSRGEAGSQSSVGHVLGSLKCRTLEFDFPLTKYRISFDRWTAQWTKPSTIGLYDPVGAGSRQ